MNNDIKEIICCDKCIHRDVCSFKGVYLEALGRLSKTFRDYSENNDTSFITMMAPNCEHYRTNGVSQKGGIR